MKSILLLSVVCFTLNGCGSRDGHSEIVSYNTKINDGQHVAYGSTDIRLFDMVSPEGHHCTAAISDNNNGGVAIYCWN